MVNEHPHPAQWLTPSPLWEKALAADRRDQPAGRSDRFRRPALLRFASDEFMKEMEAALAATDEGARKLPDYVARFETHETPEAVAVGWEDTPSSKRTLKLYQPAHGRAYLVAASLVCRVAGLPERTVDHSKQETAGFVIRLLKQGKEFAWIPGSGWVEADKTKSPTGEERRPLFSMSVMVDGRRRRVMAGYIPTASRETYAGGALIPAPGGQPLQGETDPREAMLRSRVLTPLADLYRTAVDDATARETSYYILDDLCRILADTALVPVLNAIKAGGPNPGGRLDKLYTFLTEKTMAQGDVTLSQALLGYNTGNQRVYNLRFMSYPAADPAKPDGVLAELLDAVQAAVKDQPYQPKPGPDTEVPALPRFDPNGGDIYIIRCVYHRPCCNCPERQVLSEESVPFQIAPFYDPEAPARPVRIVMPADTSIKALRSYKKNVSFIVSDKLRSQMERFRSINLDKLEKGNIDGPKAVSFGMICTLSIPIITICALILLLIIINILNIIFWWIPYVKICFPISFKAESQ